MFFHLFSYTHLTFPMLFRFLTSVSFLPNCLENFPWMNLFCVMFSLDELWHPCTFTEVLAHSQKSLHIPSGACTFPEVLAHSQKSLHIPRGPCTFPEVLAHSQRSLHIPNTISLYIWFLVSSLFSLFAFPFLTLNCFFSGKFCFFYWMMLIKGLGNNGFLKVLI